MADCKARFQVRHFFSFLSACIDLPVNQANCVYTTILSPTLHSFAFFFYYIRFMFNEAIY